MSDLTESMARAASAYDRFEADNVAAWVDFLKNNGSCSIRVYTGMTDQGRRQVFLMACPETASAADLGAMIEAGSSHPAVMELSHPCPPFC